jgi:hypothetical protein
MRVHPRAPSELSDPATRPAAPPPGEIDPPREDPKAKYRPPAPIAGHRVWPSGPVRVAKAGEQLHKLAGMVRGTLDVVPAEQAAYLFIGNPPQKFGKAIRVTGQQSRPGPEADRPRAVNPAGVAPSDAQPAAESLAWHAASLHVRPAKATAPHPGAQRSQARRLGDQRQCPSSSSSAQPGVPRRSAVPRPHQEPTSDGKLGVPVRRRPWHEGRRSRPGPRAGSAPGA